MKVVIERIPKTGPKGDRDRERHPYFDHRVHVVKDGEEPSMDTVVHRIDGFNHQWTTIRDVREVQKEVSDYAYRLAERLGDGATRLLVEQIDELKYVSRDRIEEILGELELMTVAPEQQMRYAQELRILIGGL